MHLQLVKRRLDISQVLRQAEVEEPIWDNESVEDVRRHSMQRVLSQVDCISTSTLVSRQ